jgi:1,4-dihydroxy-2-naphthoate octaprenyltransferase
MSAMLRAWLLAMRAPSLGASAVAVLVGTAAVADETFRPGLFALALLGTLALQTGTNLINDYYDHVLGVDTAVSLGPSGVIQRGLLAPRAVLVGGFVALGVGGALGGVAAAFSGWPVLLLGGAGVLAAYAYTAPPVKLAYRGLGELTAFAFMGPVIVLGAAYVQIEDVSRDAFLVSLPVGLLAAAILQANNLRDIEGDRRHNKLTTATLLGRPWASVELGALLFAPFVAVPTFVATGRAAPAGLLVFATLPPALWLIGRISESTDARTLQRVLGGTVLLHLAFGLLWAFGLALEAWTD